MRGRKGQGVCVPKSYASELKPVASVTSPRLGQLMMDLCIFKHSQRGSLCPPRVFILLGIIVLWLNNSLTKRAAKQRVSRWATEKEAVCPKHPQLCTWMKYLVKPQCACSVVVDALHQR